MQVEVSFARTNVSTVPTRIAVTFVSKDFPHPVAKDSQVRQGLGQWPDDDPGTQHHRTQREVSQAPG